VCGLCVCLCVCVSVCVRVPVCGCCSFQYVPPLPPPPMVQVGSRKTVGGDERASLSTGIRNVAELLHCVCMLNPQCMMSDAGRCDTGLFVSGVGCVCVQWGTEHCSVRCVRVCGVGFVLVFHDTQEACLVKGCSVWWTHALALSAHVPCARTLAWSPLQSPPSHTLLAMWVGPRPPNVGACTRTHLACF